MELWFSNLDKASLSHLLLSTDPSYRSEFTVLLLRAAWIVSPILLVADSFSPRPFEEETFEFLVRVSELRNPEPTHMQMRRPLDRETRLTLPLLLSAARIRGFQFQEGFLERSSQ
jgi:hypothetical protein